MNISAQRAGLDAVPWTKTTGMRPGWYGSEREELGRQALAEDDPRRGTPPVRSPTRPTRSARRPAPPWVPASRGTRRSPTWTVSVSNVAVELEARLEAARAQLRPGVVEPEECTSPAASHAPGPRGPRSCRPGDRGRGEGRPEAGAAVPVPEPLTSTSATETKSVRRRSSQVSWAASKAMLHLAKGERKTPPAKSACCPSGREQSFRERAIVQVAGSSGSRIIRLRGRDVPAVGRGTHRRREPPRSSTAAAWCARRGGTTVRRGRTGPAGPRRPDTASVWSVRRAASGSLSNRARQIGPVEDDLREAGSARRRTRTFRVSSRWAVCESSLGHADGRGAGRNEE
ncbi:MAG: hypothetical protein MZV64_73755 [Ignavibacteriales bacterium]|nr:hypothetical protein [Ignavibacteriales bacterium]